MSEASFRALAHFTGLDTPLTNAQLFFSCLEQTGDESGSPEGGQAPGRAGHLPLLLPVNNQAEVPQHYVAVYSACTVPQFENPETTAMPSAIRRFTRFSFVPM